LKQIYSRSITVEVLKEDGEIEQQLFTEDIKYQKTIARGWRVMYSLKYDEVFMELNSAREKQIFLIVRDSFKSDKIEVAFNQSKIAKRIGATRQTVNKVFKKLEKLECIMKLDSGAYRLNPYCFIPYKSDGVKLQQEWNELLENRKYFQSKLTKS